MCDTTKKSQFDFDVTKKTYTVFDTYKMMSAWIILANVGNESETD